MSVATDLSHNSNANLVQSFQALDADQQLALFWFIYTEMGESITPAAPGASTVSPTVAQGLYDQVKEKSQEEQLQIQRDLVNRTGGDISREYGALSDTTKLLFWYLLAQGMDSTEIIPLPEGYKLSSSAESLLEKIKQIEFSEQMSVFRDIVAPMGVDPT
ncbi:orange carotenoid protein N-terminal domain-containing protein [Merismopedia glauca]|uniref:Orange carotenoid protein n=1 Tax=Merismopedia glauca CCAP 1448/3 TaxID=1296344 RepID=A0A2T1C466_9CYAN|nr:orange carotenoid protein N-terminal domain-containing protein [Merismopedia glauca]PSB02937.1 Orange carotenoid protein [Merismopedia glauca CCAP 1448/3]